MFLLTKTHSRIFRSPSNGCHIGKLEEVLSPSNQNNIKIASIYGATLGLAKVGLFDSIKHTNNAKDYLLFSSYQGSEHYTDVLSLSDEGIITASGTASLEFAREIFRELHLYTGEVLEAWYKLFKTSSPEAFSELMKAA